MIVPLAIFNKLKISKLNIIVMDKNRNKILPPCLKASFTKINYLFEKAKYYKFVYVIIKNKINIFAFKNIF